MSFNRLDQIASASVEAAFSERVLFTPMRQGKYTTGGKDPDREALEFSALVTVDQGVQQTSGDKVGEKFGITMVAGGVRISVAASHFLYDNRILKKGDHLTALERSGSPTFEIVRVAPDNATRITLFCVEIKK